MLLIPFEPLYSLLLQYFVFNIEISTHFNQQKIFMLLSLPSIRIFNECQHENRILFMNEIYKPYASLISNLYCIPLIYVSRKK